MQLAALTGPVGLTLAALIPAALAARLTPPGLVAAGLVVAGTFGAGLWLAAAPLPPARDLFVRLVQPNVAQSLKWDSATAAATFDRLLAVTGAAPAPGGPKPDLIVWPETALPYLYDGDGPLIRSVAEAAGGARLLVGAIRIDGFRAYNALIDLLPDGTIGAIYDKHHLVPFGEYLPLPWLMDRIGLEAMTARAGYGYSAGPGPRLLDLGRLGQVLPLICYEAIFPQDLRSPERPDWLLQVTNDAWFGTFSGPYQHFAQARLRAVETGLPMVRVANTGISGVIDARGGVVAQLALGQGGHLDVALPAALPGTLYARTGDLPWAAALALLLAALALTRRPESD
jgi:apolipoprotein N-acyltransferase